MKLFQQVLLSILLGITFIENCYLPRGCEWLRIKHSSLFYKMKCDHFNEKFDEDNYTRNGLCLPTNGLVFKYSLYIQPNSAKAKILDNSFDLHKVFTHINRTFITTYQLYFTNVKGFSYDLAMNVNNLFIYINFYDSEFRFYNGENQLIKSCDDYIAPNLSKNFIVKSRLMPVPSFTFSNSRFRDPICPLVFANTTISELLFKDLVKSYYKTNYIRFVNESFQLDSYIDLLSIVNLYNLDIDLSLVNREVFKNTPKFYFDGVINSIQTDFFAHFNDLYSISFSAKYFPSYIRRQGIEWIKIINYNTSVNLTNLTLVCEQFNRFRYIEFQTKYSLSLPKEKSYLNDEDFCLFKDYPFEQLIFIRLDTINPNSFGLKFSCTDLWLMKYYNILLDCMDYNFKKDEYENILNVT